MLVVKLKKRFHFELESAVKCQSTVMLELFVVLSDFVPSVTRFGRVCSIGLLHCLNKLHIVFLQELVFAAKFRAFLSEIDYVSNILKFTQGYTMYGE